MEMIEWLRYWLENDNTKLFYMLAVILGANILDFSVGWINAKLNPKVDFSSSKAIYGIARKIVLFILLIFFIPVCMLVPQPVGISALYVLYTGYLLSELNSILHHFKLTKDDKKISLFSDFLKNVFGGNDK